MDDKASPWHGTSRTGRSATVLANGFANNGPGRAWTRLEPLTGYLHRQQVESTIVDDAGRSGSCYGSEGAGTGRAAAPDPAAYGLSPPLFQPLTADAAPGRIFPAPARENPAPRQGRPSGLHAGHRLRSSHGTNEGTRGREGETATALSSQRGQHQGRGEVNGSPVRSRGPGRLHWFTQRGSDRRAPVRPARAASPPRAQARQPEKRMVVV
jgi:hypothetical protein